jgi:CDP-alcohol phosphatidyltransferase
VVDWEPEAMSRSRPTIVELRAHVQKDRHREIGNWLARRIARPSAIYGCWLAIRLGLSAHQVTLAAICSSLGAAVAIGTGDPLLFVVGVLLAQLGFWLDHIDGQVARWRETVSLDGVYLDYLMHHAANLALGFALGYGLAARSGDTRWTIAGFAIAVGWGLLSLHNDCRYKAFFQRLKSTNLSYRVDAGGGGRPQPPAPWPRRGLGAITWPAYKVCEVHVVMIGLTVLAVPAILLPPVWLALWRAGVLFLAVLAPVLGIGRTARSVSRSTVEVEFSRWFQPVEPESALATDSSSVEFPRRGEIQAASQEKPI